MIHLLVNFYCKKDRNAQENKKNQSFDGKECMMANTIKPEIRYICHFLIHLKYILQEKKMFEKKGITTCILLIIIYCISFNNF